MATLIITPFTPRTASGRGLRTVNLARAIALTDDVVVSYVEFDGTEPAPELLVDGVVMERLAGSRGARRALTYARARRAGVPRGFARGVSPELISRFRDTLAYDRVIADGPTAAAAGLLLARGARVIYNAHNLESSFRSRLSESRKEYGSPAHLAAFETALLQSADETWLPSARDVTAAAELAPGCEARLVPNVVDVAGIRPAAPPRNGRILFVADHTYEPNRVAAQLLINQVLPRLWSTTPDATLVLVGRGIEGMSDADPRIDVVGFVDRVETVYRSVDCAVIPLQEGGGSPLKMIEAMAYGLPIVATTAAVRGVDGARAGTHFVLADDAEAAAAALADTLRGQHDHLGAAARALAEERYSIQALAEIVLAEEFAPL